MPLNLISSLLNMLRVMSSGLKKVCMENWPKDGAGFNLHILNIHLNVEASKAEFQFEIVWKANLFIWKAKHLSSPIAISLHRLLFIIFSWNMSYHVQNQIW